MLLSQGRFPRGEGFPGGRNISKLGLGILGGKKLKQIANTHRGLFVSHLKKTKPLMEGNYFIRHKWLSGMKITEKASLHLVLVHHTAMMLPLSPV